MITIDIDLKQFDRLIGDAAKQVRFAASKALNATALQFQVAERARLGREFTLRRRDFVEKQGVKIARGDFATKTSLVVRIGMDEKADFLAKFEDGEDKKPTEGRLALAIPREVKRNKNEIVTKANRPRAFRFTQVHTATSTGVRIFKGARRVFMIQKPDGTGVILQRFGRGNSERAGVRVMYALTPKGTISASLHFVDTATKTVNERWAQNFERAFADAMRTAKP
jgi:hypothetical protein